MCALETVTIMNQELAQAYANSKVTIWSSNGTVIATQARAGDATSSGSISELFDAQALFVITAWNPESVELTAEENSRANQALLVDLQTLGCPILNATGSSLDNSWSEESFAVLVAAGAPSSAIQNRILDLAIKYRQNAFFKISSETIEVLGALYQDLHVSMPLAIMRY
jgi:Protein of unknown function (DUF3293)